MLPILLKIGPLTIHTYGFMMAVGVGLGPLVPLRPGQESRDWTPTASRRRLLHHHRLPHRGQAHPVRRQLLLLPRPTPRSSSALARSGGVFQGGLTFGVIFALWYFRRKKIPTWTMADLIAPGPGPGPRLRPDRLFQRRLLLRQRVRRCPGRVIFNERVRPRPDRRSASTRRSIPVQLYEAVLNFLNFVVLFLVLKKKKFDGQVFSLLHHQLLDHPLLHRVLPRRPCRQGLSSSAARRAFSSLSYPQLFCVLGLVAGVVLARRPEAAQTCPKRILVVGPEAGRGHAARRLSRRQDRRPHPGPSPQGHRRGRRARRLFRRARRATSSRPATASTSSTRSPSPEGALIPQNIPLKIIYMDADVIVIDKPPRPRRPPRGRAIRRGRWSTP